MLKIYCAQKRLWNPFTSDWETIKQIVLRPVKRGCVFAGLIVFAFFFCQVVIRQSIKANKDIKSFVGRYEQHLLTGQLLSLYRTNYA